MDKAVFLLVLLDWEDVSSKRNFIPRRAFEGRIPAN
jgi:hypothetical protein